MGWNDAPLLEEKAKSWNDAPLVEPKNVKQEVYSPTEGNTFLQNLAIGTGKGLTDLYTGGKQVLGLASAEDVARKRAIDAAIMETGGGQIGNVVGQVAGLAPAMLIPGVNTYAGAAVLGAGAGALQPTTEDESRLLNTSLGAVGGVVGQKLGNVVGQKIGQKVASEATRKSQNAARDAALKEIQESGFSVPRSLYEPSFLSNRLESVGGKAATLQQASAKNQDLVNSLARKAIGVSDDTPLSLNTLENVRKNAYKTYDEITDVSKGAKIALEQLKQARADAKGWFNAYNRSLRPDDLAKAREYQQIADIAESVIDDYAKQVGKANIIPKLNQARTSIAKTYTVERAMNRATGDIDPRIIGRLYQKGSPLSGGLEQIGQLATAFPKVAQPTQQSAGAGISALEPMASAIYGGVGQMATGDPRGFLAAGIPLLRGPARSLALSKAMQTTPQYGSTLLNMLNRSSPALPYLGAPLGGVLGANARIDEEQ
jgi:hypothetical protein